MYFLAWVKRRIKDWRLPVKIDRFTLLLVGVALLYFVTDYFYVRLSLPLLTFFPTGDEPHYLIISQTLLKYHSLDVMQNYLHKDYMQFYFMPIDPHVVRAPNGHLLPLHNIGGPLLWLLPFALLGRLGVVFFISAIALLILINIHKLLRLMGISERVALRIDLAYALASQLFIYSHLVFVELLGALVCIYVVRKLLQQKLLTREIALCAVLLGLLPWIHIRFAQLEASLFILLLYKLYRQYRLHSIRQYMALLVPILLLFFALEIYSIQVWGTWNPAASQVANHNRPFEILPFKSIFLGLFFDQEQGLLFSAPIFLFLLIGYPLALRKPVRGYHLSILFICVPYILIFASFRNWFGGYNPPGRYLLVLLPMLCYYPAYALEHLDYTKNVLVEFWYYFAIGYGFLYNLASIAPPYNGFGAESGFNPTLKLLDFIHHPVTKYLPSLFVCKARPAPGCEAHQTWLFTLWISAFAFVALLMILQWRKNVLQSREKYAELEG